jgi:hypothetical protein
VLSINVIFRRGCERNPGVASSAGYVDAVPHGEGGHGELLAGQAQPVRVISEGGDGPPYSLGGLRAGLAAVEISNGAHWASVT